MRLRAHAVALLLVVGVLPALWVVTHGPRRVAEALTVRANTELREDGDPDRALETLAAAERFGPRVARVHRLRGEALRRRASDEERGIRGERVLPASILRGAEVPMTPPHLVPEYREAREQFLRSARIDNHPFAWRMALDLDWFVPGMQKFGERDAEEALRHSDNHRALLRAGMALFEAGRFEEADDCLRRWFPHVPDIVSGGGGAMRPHPNGQEGSWYDFFEIAAAARAGVLRATRPEPLRSARVQSWSYDRALAAWQEARVGSIRDQGG